MAAFFSQLPVLDAEWSYILRADPPRLGKNEGIMINHFI